MMSDIAVIDGLTNDVKLQDVAAKSDIDNLRRDLEDFKISLFKWLIPILLGQAGFIVALIKFL